MARVVYDLTHYRDPKTSLQYPMQTSLVQSYQLRYTHALWCLNKPIQCKCENNESKDIWMDDVAKVRKWRWYLVMLHPLQSQKCQQP
jgi:hypothetical protein